MLLPLPLRLSRFARLRPLTARVVLAAAAVFTAAYLATGLTADTRLHYDTPAGEDPVTGNDIQLFRLTAARVRAGDSYHEAALAELRAHRFPVRSSFNFRLPTFAWVLAAFPDEATAETFWVGFGLTVFGMAVVVAVRDAGWMAAPATALMVWGAVWWCFDPSSIYFQETWAGLLIVLSVSATALGWRTAAVAAGLTALAFRELTLPYCVIAGVVCWRTGRPREAIAWALGVAGFFLFLFWHTRMVARLVPDLRGSPGDWMLFGGLAFDLVTVQMNRVLFDTPGWLLAVYLSAAVLGLAGWDSEAGVTAGVTVLTYLTAFAVVGGHFNRYWGLMTSPLLACGIAHAPAALIDLLRVALADPAVPTPPAGPPTVTP